MMRQIGKGKILFTNVSPQDVEKYFAGTENGVPFSEYFSHESIVDITRNFPNKVCLLDSEDNYAVLDPVDATKFDYFLLGGILGNVDEFDTDKTSILRAHNYARRNLEHAQMTTDTAAITTHKIINEGSKFSDLKFIDRPEFKISENEYLVVPFRFLIKNDEPRLCDNEGNEIYPLIADGILDLLLEKHSF